MQDKQFPVLFQGSRYAERSAIGKRNILETVTPEALKRFYHDWYRPDLMAVVVVGEVDPKQIEGLVRQHFGHLTNPPNERKREVYPVPGHKETLVSVAESVPGQPVPGTRDTSVGQRPRRGLLPHRP